MLHLQNISFEFGGNYLFRNLDWYIKPRERIALIGKNGAGKSTLLKLISGEYELREGNINKQGSTTIGYLSQDMIVDNESYSVLETAMLAFEEALKIHSQIDKLVDLIETDPSTENVQKLSDLQERFTALDGYTIENRTAAILEGLGFKTSDLSRPFQEFSGGWRMRVILARMLLREPDLILLDEPTNHLDLPSIEWLEAYLNNYPGTVIIVSHDREFLNRMTGKTVELNHQQMYVWEGNYDFYLQSRDERDDLLQRKFENQKQFIKDQEKFINRFRYKASKAKAVQSRIKMLEKLDIVEEIEEDKSDMRVRFKIAKRSGKVLMKLENISKSFGTNKLFEQLDLEVNRGDKIALIGANGTGKSTLLRIIADSETFEGHRTEGHQVQASFYAQHQLESLHLDNQILEELKSAAPHKLETELRTLLGCFLFTGDDVFKKIKVLSGGEKARVALAKVLVSEANFLILDEPTNHLDMDSIEVIIEALERYEGTLIFVSHNRYFISHLANKILWIENERVQTYPGSYGEFQHKYKSKLQTEERVKSKTESKSPGKKEKTKDPVSTGVKSLHQKISALEEELTEKQRLIEEIKQELQNTESLSMEQINGLSSDFETKTRELNEINARIDDLMEDLIRLEDS